VMHGHGRWAERDAVKGSSGGGPLGAPQSINGCCRDIENWRIGDGKEKLDTDR
jgi:hypothetical protein